MKTLSLISVAFLTLLIPGCFSFFGQNPRYVDDSRIEIREGESGRYYAVQIGASNTTVVEAILGPGDLWSISYLYSDSKALDVFRISVKTTEALISMDSVNSVRQDNGSGIITESDTISVNPALFEAMVRSDAPVIFIEGGKGRIIIETGTQSRENLRDLLDFAAEMQSG